MYRVDFEVGEHEELAKKIIEDYLGPERSKTLITLPYGYECELAIQCVPDIVALLAKSNIGVYQVGPLCQNKRCLDLRRDGLGKTSAQWHEPKCESSVVHEDSAVEAR